MLQNVFLCVLEIFTCTQPSPLPAGYTNVVETGLQSNEFDVTAECAAGFSGTAVATACSQNGPYTLSGCAGTSSLISSLLLFACDFDIVERHIRDILSG